MARSDVALTGALEVAVPLWIEQLAELEPAIRWARIAEWGSAAATEVASKGDVLMFGSKRRGEAAEVFNHLARGLAAAAFVPGGVKFAGLHFEWPACQLAECATHAREAA